MNKWLFCVIIVAVLIVGFLSGGFAGYKYYPKKNPIKTASTADTPSTSTTATATDTTTSSAELETCLKAKWGEDKYNAITANPALASVDDKFNALPCYK